MNGSRVSPVHQIISEDKQSHHYSTELSVSATKSHTGAICNLSLCYSTEGFSVRQGIYKFKSQDRFSRVISDFVKHFSDRLNSVSGLFSKCVSYLTCKGRKKESSALFYRVPLVSRQQDSQLSRSFELKFWTIPYRVVS